MVYFVCDVVTQEIKIGHSRTPAKRVAELQTGNAHRLDLLGAIPGTEDDESALHNRFAAHRLQGEWFSRDILEAVMEIISSTREVVAMATDNRGPTDGPAPELQMVSQIPHLRVKSFKLKLMEEVGGSGRASPWGTNEEVLIDPTTTSVVEWLEMVRGLKQDDRSSKAAAIRSLHLQCSYEIKCVLEFQKNMTPEELQPVRNAFFTSQGLKPRYLFFDEDNSVIPFSAGTTHVRGGPEVMTGVEGECFRVLVLATGIYQSYPEGRESAPRPDKYPGEHPLTGAKRIAVHIRD
jgi:hypothetical protein